MHRSGWSVRFDLTPMRLIWAIAVLTGAGLALWHPQPFAAADWVAVVVIAIWCLSETTMRRNWLALVTLPALALGPGCALPLYLFVRSCRMP